MSAQDHLKIASAEMMKASNQVRQEISDLRGEVGKLQKNVEQDVAQLTIMLQTREQEVKATDDSGHRSQSQTHINTLVRQIADRRNQLKLDQQRIQESIREKESLISSFDQQARSLQP
ncbi:hypothetical protein H0X10_04040 [Candidatus Saccharibacteria bacterium]|nr:hypothetical protein [Candidatus Saccharibacteria bacterium]